MALPNIQNRGSIQLNKAGKIDLVCLFKVGGQLTYFTTRLPEISIKAHQEKALKALQH